MDRDGRYYQSLKDRGICTACKRSPAEPERTMCGRCLQEMRDRRRAQYRKRRAAGNCFHCDRPAVDGCYCAEHGASMREYLTRYQRGWERKRYNRLKEAGICTYCHKRPATEGKTMCTSCRTELNKKRRAARSRG